MTGALRGLRFVQGHTFPGTGTHAKTRISGRGGNGRRGHSRYQISVTRKRPTRSAISSDPSWVDAQGEPSGLNEGPGGRVTPTPQLVEAIRQRRLDVLNATVAEPGNGPDRFRLAIDSIADYNRTINDNRALFARVESISDIHAARALCAHTIVCPCK